MSDPKQSAPVPPSPKASSTVSYGAGSLPAVQPPAPPPPPVPGTAAPAPNVVAKGPLSPHTVELVQRTWSQVLPIADAAAGLFYDRLFEMDPSVRPLFKSDMAQQKKKLMQMLSVAVDGLANPQRLIPVLEQLGARHVGYMVQEHHYGLVGEALLWTLREGLGDSFTPEVESAWREVYGLVSSVMKKAAASAGRTSAPPGPAAPRPQPAPPPPTQSAPPPVPTQPPVQRPAAPPPPPPGVAAPASNTAAKGPLSPHTVELVQRTWSQVLPISDAAASLFYDRLFEMDPSVRPLFKSDMAQQKKKLMQTLSVAVDGLANPQRLIPVLEQLGARHVGYMVQEHHYGLVGEALLWTLREGLGDSFTPEVESAWREVYGLVSSVMKKAASSAAPRSPVRAPEPLPTSPPIPEADVMEEENLLPPLQPQAKGEDTIPYHLLAQTRVVGLQPYAQPLQREAHPSELRPFGAPAPEPSTAAVSIPVSIPREVNVNVHLNVKLEADSALSALLLRAPAAAPTAPAAPVALAAPRPAPPEPAAPARGTVSPVLLVALCVLVSVSTVVALGPLGQAASTLGLADVARLAAPVFTLAALAVGYWWGRGRGSERHK
jgi:hemoglobin-like flavoprotein